MNWSGPTRSCRRLRRPWTWGPRRRTRAEECREALAALLSRGLEVAAGIVREDRDLDSADALAVARVIHLLTSAHDRITGRLP